MAPLKTDPQYLTEEDGYFMPEVGPWANTKYRKIAYYCSLFSRGMKNKWDCRVYLDLFAGAGKSRIKNTNEVVPGSPLLALSVDDPFDKYIFCEAEPQKFEALDRRIQRYFQDRNVSILKGDTNSCLKELLTCMPHFHREFKGLTFCFVDPFKMDELNFATISKIAEEIYVDFLILIPSYMDIHRNEGIYTKYDNTSLDKYLGTTLWREKWSDPQRTLRDFGVFIADLFGQQMRQLGYIYEGPEDMEFIKMETGNNLPLYHLAFFSKSNVGLRFWRDTKRNTKEQMSLF